MNHLHEWMADPFVNLGYPQNVAPAKEAICFEMPEEDECLGIASIGDLIKLPYPTCWFEGDGRRVMIFEDDYVCDNVDHRKQRLGFMLVAKEHGGFVARGYERDFMPGRGWTWSQTVRSFEWDPTLHAFGNQSRGHWILRGDIDDVKVLGMVHAERGADLRRLPRWEKETLDRWFDWIGRFLTVLNCGNVHKQRHDPDLALQKSRARKGKLPLFSYWTLRLNGRRESVGSLGGTHASPRLHLRRGHPRQHAPGKWTWVQPHVVGNKELGIVHKDYAATPSFVDGVRASSSP